MNDSILQVFTFKYETVIKNKDITVNEKSLHTLFNVNDIRYDKGIWECFKADTIKNV